MDSNRTIPPDDVALPFDLFDEELLNEFNFDHRPITSNENWTIAGETESYDQNTLKKRADLDLDNFGGNSNLSNISITNIQSSGTVATVPPADATVVSAEMCPPVGTFEGNGSQSISFTDLFPEHSSFDWTSFLNAPGSREEAIVSIPSTSGMKTSEVFKNQEQPSSSNSVGKATCKRPRRPRTQKVYEITQPLQDEEAEKKRIRAIRAKRHRDAQKEEIQSLKNQIEEVTQENDQLKSEIMRLRKKEEEQTKIIIDFKTKANSLLSACFES